MNTHDIKLQKVRIISAVNEFSKIHSSGKSIFYFTDNRKKSFLQRKLQESTNKSPHILKAVQLQAMAHNHLLHQQLTAQKKANKFIPSTMAQTIQRKGPRPLVPQLTLVMQGQEEEKIKSLFDTLKVKIEQYDNSPDERPSVQVLAIKDIIRDLNAWVGMLGLKEKLFTYNRIIQNIRNILTEELQITSSQEVRLKKYTANPEAPYEQMTTEGMLWNLPDFAHNVERVRKKGKAYFEHLSARNIEFIQGEIKTNKLADKEWFIPFVNRAIEGLSAAVVNHYTTSIRAQTMLREGMKSKMMLERDLPSFKHNTSIFDDLGLANSGFLFFFIEPSSAPLRNTRFAKGDVGAEPARISIPIKESGLLTKGWLMLSDFAQREYPDIMTKEDNSAHTSWLPTRKQEEQQPEFNRLVRHFQLGFGGIQAEEMMQIEDSEKRQAFSAVAPMARGDEKSRQVYTGQENQKLEIPDRLLNNILVGKDIIPGIANRSALEVARISFVNPDLGARLSTLTGDSLMEFMLKDLFRPQAMIPNDLAIEDRHVQLAGDREFIARLTKLTEEILDLGRQLAGFKPDVMVTIDRAMSDIKLLGHFKLSDQVVQMELLRKKLLELSKTATPSKEVIIGLTYIGSFYDLTRAIMEIAEDRGAELYSLELVDKFKRGAPFQSKSAMITAFESVMASRKEVATSIADYLVENSE